MHLDIRWELEGGDVRRDQSAFDLWREEYNTERTHEALGMRVPAKICRRSERVYEWMPKKIDYGGMETRKVGEMSGVIDCRKEQSMVTSAIGGSTMGLSPQSNGLVGVWFSKPLLGHIDPETSNFQATRPGRLEAGRSQTEECNP